MAISFVNSVGLGQTNTTTAVSTTIPTGIQLGDLLIVFHGNSNNYRRFSGHANTPPTMLDGWILVDDVTVTTNVYFMVAMKTATSTEVAAAGSNLQIATLPNSTGSPRRTSYCVAYRGALPAAQQPIDSNLNHVTRPTLPTCVAAGNSADNTYLVTSDAAAAPINTEDRVRIFLSDGTLKEQTLFTVAGKASAFGFTNISVAPNFAAPPATGDQLHVETNPDINTGTVTSTNPRDWYVAGWGAYREQGVNTAATVTSDAEVDRGAISSQTGVFGSVTGASDSDGTISVSTHSLDGTFTPWVIDDKNSWIGIIAAAPEVYQESAGVSLAGSSLASTSLGYSRLAQAVAAGLSLVNRSLFVSREVQADTEGAPQVGRVSTLSRRAVGRLAGLGRNFRNTRFSRQFASTQTSNPILDSTTALNRSLTSTLAGTPGVLKRFFRTETSVASGVGFLYTQRALLMQFVSMLAVVGHLEAARVVIRQFVASMFGSPALFRGHQTQQRVGLTAAATVSRGLSQQAHVALSGVPRVTRVMFEHFASQAAFTPLAEAENVIARYFTVVASGIPALGSRLGKLLGARLTASGQLLRSLSASRSAVAVASGLAAIQRGFWRTFASGLQGTPFAERGNSLIFQVMSTGVALVSRGSFQDALANMAGLPGLARVRGFTLSVVASLTPTMGRAVLKRIQSLLAVDPKVAIEGFTQLYITVTAYMLGVPRVTKWVPKIVALSLAGRPVRILYLHKDLRVSLQGVPGVSKTLWKILRAFMVGTPEVQRSLEQISVQITRTSSFQPKVRVVVHRGGAPEPENTPWTAENLEIKWVAETMDIGTSVDTLEIGWSGELV